MDAPTSSNKMIKNLLFMHTFIFECRSIYFPCLGCLNRIENPANKKNKITKMFCEMGRKYANRYQFERLSNLSGTISVAYVILSNLYFSDSFYSWYYWQHRCGYRKRKQKHKQAIIAITITPTKKLFNY